MSYINSSEMWDWRCQIYDEDSTSTEASHHSLLNEVNQNVDHISYMFDHEITPVKACSLPRYASNSDIDSVSPSSKECLDPSSKGWITGCFNVAENEMNLCDEDLAFDIPIDVRELCNTSAPEYEANLVMNTLNLKTPRNVAFRGTKSYIRSSTFPQLGSTVVYPFAFIKPCGVLGDTTLKDINRRIHNPPKPPKAEEPIAATSPFSGKPVVGKTKIQTQGRKGKGNGSITIMRTKG